MGRAGAPDLLHFGVDGQRRAEGRREEQRLDGGQVGLDAARDVGSVLFQLLLHPLQRRRHLADACRQIPSSSFKKGPTISRRKWNGRMVLCVLLCVFNGNEAGTDDFVHAAVEEVVVLAQRPGGQTGVVGADRVLDVVLRHATVPVLRPKEQQDAN